MRPLPNLQNLSASQLIQPLQQFNHDNDLGLFPVWLHNDGQNVIGFFPKTTFEIYVKENQYQLIQQTRQSFLSNKKSYEQTVHENFDSNELTTLLENYQKQQMLIQNDDSKASDKHSYKNGFIGFVNYDFSANNLANPSQINADYINANQPLLFLGHYDVYLTFDDNNWQLNATSEATSQQLSTIEKWLNKLASNTESIKTKSLKLKPVWKKTDYQHAFDKVQDYLKAGDCYQINLTQCWQGMLTNHQLVDYLPSLHQSTNATFAGYVGLDNYELLSCSPELFFTFSKNAQGENIIFTKPIKGTRPRGQNDADDLAYKNELANSEKDSAENVMIVDLLRNDLGKYAKTGTVKVPKLFDIESFSNVHHMVSTITATLKDDVSPWTVLFESLPAGSITGTPKKRAVEIINELEAKPRGAYCGTMGYQNFDGTGQWNVLIRTLQSAQENVSLWAGGGITIASDCDAEYQECFDKVGNLLTILAKED